jgi:plastocyanin
MPTFRLFPGALLVVILGAACSREPAPPPPAPAPPAAAASASGLTLGSGQAPRGAVVTLEPASTDEFPPPSGPVVLDQYSKQFVPAVLLARVGQPVEFRNSEDMPHNVNVTRTPSGTAVFNVSTDPFQKHVHAFDREGRYNVTCDIHAGMQAFLIVTRTPYAVVVDDSGAFTIPDVRPGAYLLRIAAAGETTERKVDVAGARMNVQ